MSDKIIVVNGENVPVAAVELALKRVFDAVQKGKFSGIMREASLIEVIVRGEIRRQTEPGNAAPVVLPPI